jgi:hypothetical protein
MKTRRNHRHKTATATATGRRRRNTQIHRRKRTTVSSGRRRHFFKRGGGEKEDNAIKPILEGLDFGILKNAMIQQDLIDNGSNVSLKLNTNTNSMSISSTTEPTTKVSFTLDDMLIEFKSYTSGKLGEVYVFVDTQLYGKIIIVINTNTEVKDYSAEAATAINSAVLSYYETQIKPIQQ